MDGEAIHANKNGSIYHTQQHLLAARGLPTISERLMTVTTCPSICFPMGLDLS